MEGQEGISHSQQIFEQIMEENDQQEETKQKEQE